MFTSHKKGNRHGCESHIEIFHITSSPTQTHLPPSHHDSARQLATVSFSAITHEGSHANHSHTQVLSSWLLRTLVVNSPDNVNGSWVLERRGVMLVCLTLLWHIAVKLSPQDKGWHRDGQQLPVSGCFPPYPYSCTGQQLAVKIKKGQCKPKSPALFKCQSLFSEENSGRYHNRGSRQTLLSPKKQKSVFYGSDRLDLAESSCMVESRSLIKEQTEHGQKSLMQDLLLFLVKWTI